VNEESTAVAHPFLDLAPLSAAHFASIEDRVAGCSPPSRTL
jgi:hypothetical protein